MSFSLSVQVIVFIVAFLLTLIAGPIFIPVLRRLKFGQTVREDGPQTHLKKMGTPTMGGIIFLIPMLIVGSYAISEYPGILPLIMVTLGFGLVGFVDDFIKVIKKRKDGLYPGQKTLGLLIVSGIFCFYIVYIEKIGTEIIVPFKGIYSYVALPMWIYIPLIIIILYAATNSVNLADGADGLAAGVTLIVFVFFAVAAMAKGEWDYIKVFSAIMAGGCLGFLTFNAHPARVFMGDNGSLALGGAVAGISIMMKMPWILLIVGIIYVVESLSVILQVYSYKTRGKRIFKMAPLHHHFELCGWPEKKVVKVFWFITFIYCILGFLTLRLRLF